MTRILVVNPNTSDDVTSLIHDEARRAAGPGTELEVRTAPFGVQYIETRLESLFAASAVAEVVAKAAVDRPAFDAVLVAAFGDPGLPALKELLDVPVIGISEAAFATAALLGRRFSIIAITRRLGAWYRDCVELFGIEGRLASIRALSEPFSDIAAVRESFGPTLVSLANAAVAEDSADVVILAGAPLAGLARQVASQIPVPVIDGIACGIRQCEALAALRPVWHRVDGFSRLPRKPRTGLSPEVDRALDRQTH